MLFHLTGSQKPGGLIEGKHEDVALALGCGRPHISDVFNVLEADGALRRLQRGLCRLSPAASLRAGSGSRCVRLGAAGLPVCGGHGVGGGEPGSASRPSAAKAVQVVIPPAARTAPAATATTVFPGLNFVLSSVMQLGVSRTIGQNH